MFKKSVFEGQPTDAPVAGRQIFNGYAGVRTTPANPPRLLKQQIIEGKDPIAIWYHHFHAERFDAMEEWRGVRLEHAKLKNKWFMPPIADMRPHEILEFCKSIDVHPAHLIPFDADKRLSLPMPLLELLIEMGNGDVKEGSYVYDLDDRYLAKAAIAYECERIRAQMAEDKRREDGLKNPSKFLSAIFMIVLSNPDSMRDIAKARIPKMAQGFGNVSSRSYPYVERVKDISIFVAETELAQITQQADLKCEILKGRIEGFVKEYKKMVNPKGRADVPSHVDAMNFMDEVIDELGRQKIIHLNATSAQVADAVYEVLRHHAPHIENYNDVQEQFKRLVGERGKTDISYEEDQYLHEPDAHMFHGLASAMSLVFMGERNLETAKENRIKREGQYIREVGYIRDAFETIQHDYHRNLLNNRVLLGICNISVLKYVAPQASPR